MDGLIDEECDCDSGKTHGERLHGGEGEPIYAAGVPMILFCTNLNNDILNLERSGDSRTKARSFRQVLSHNRAAEELQPPSQVLTKPL